MRTGLTQFRTPATAQLSGDIARARLPPESASLSPILPVVGTFVAWLALLVTSHGLLVWSAIRPSLQEGGQASLDCTFFTGLGTVTLQYWYDSQGTMGRVICPRLKDFR